MDSFALVMLMVMVNIQGWVRESSHKHNIRSTWSIYTTTKTSATTAVCVCVIVVAVVDVDVLRLPIGDRTDRATNRQAGRQTNSERNRLAGWIAKGVCLKSSLTVSFEFTCDPAPHKRTVGFLQVSLTTRMRDKQGG